MFLMIFKGRTFDGVRLIENSEFGVDTEKGVIEYLDQTSKSPATIDGYELNNQDVTFLPGLIDTHIHFFGTGSHSLDDWVLTDKTIVTIRSIEDSKNLLNAGYTTVRTLGDKVSLPMSKAEKIGLLYGPRIISAGFSIAETGGNDDPKNFDLDYAKQISYSYYCDSPWECRKAVRMNLREGAESIKAYSSSSFSGGGAIRSQLTVEELSAIVDESHKKMVKTASHAYGNFAISNSLEAGFDSIEHGLGLTGDMAEEMKKKGTFYVPTIATYIRSKSSGNSIKDEMINKHIDYEIKLAYETGLKIAAGTDYVGTIEDPHGTNYREISYISNTTNTEFGLRSGTSLAAECVGLENNGQISKNFIADVIAVRGNPLANIESLNPNNILFVMKSGKILKKLL